LGCPETFLVYPEKFLYVLKNFFTSGKRFLRSAQQFWRKILISDGNAVGKSDTTPPLLYPLRYGPADWISEAKAR
jgi:hypothetical protein